MNSARGWFVVPVANLHAPRVVEQHGDDVLLRDGGLDDQRGTEQAEHHQRQRGHAQRREDDAIARPAVDADAAVGEDGRAHDERSDAGGYERRRRDVEAEFALLEDDRPIRKECLEKFFEHQQLQDSRAQGSP